MPIHGPRKDPRKRQKDKTGREAEIFDKMLRDWLDGKNPHKYDLHFPDYSCCFPKLKAGYIERWTFCKAMMRLDIPVIERLRQQFEGALWDLKERASRNAEESRRSAEDGESDVPDSRGAYLH